MAISPADECVRSLLISDTPTSRNAIILLNDWQPLERVAWCATVLKKRVQTCIYKLDRIKPDCVTRTLFVLPKPCSSTCSLGLHNLDSFDPANFLTPEPSHLSRHAVLHVQHAGRAYMSVRWTIRRIYQRSHKLINKCETPVHLALWTLNVVSCHDCWRNQQLETPDLQG